MAFDLAKVLADRHGENFELHSEFMNPQMARVLRTEGFDRFYVRGEGCYLYDDRGERYLDMLSGFGVYALGRSHPGIKAALHQALDLDLPNMVQIDCALLPGLLAEALVARAHDDIRRAFFCNSGAEAVEAAIKFARYATKRPRIVYAGHAFHGLTTGALALNGGAEFKKRLGPLLPCAEVPFGGIDALRRQLRRGDVAAFVVEPIQGKGVNVATAEYWREVQEVCRRYKTLFVADEVQTGLGRTGRFFWHQHWNLEPGIITVSTALSGGYIPVGAMLCTEKVFMSVFSSMDRAMVHSSTFGRNQLAMVAGLATLDALDEEGIVERARGTGPPSSPRQSSCRSSTGTGSSPRSPPTTRMSSSCSPRSSRARPRWTPSSTPSTTSSPPRTRAPASCSSSAGRWGGARCGGGGAGRAAMAARTSR